MPKNRIKNKPAKAAHWLTVRNQGDLTEMIISGVIGSSWYDSSGTTSKEFRDKFGAIPKGQKINVRINSEGGSVQDALEIYNVIQSRKDDVTTFNDGYALSSASVILCAGGRSVTPHASITMIHEPWSMTCGDESDHLKAAEMLAKHGDTIAEIYARKTGKTQAEMRDAMKKESWFTGAEACDYGLADETDDEEAVEEDELIEDRAKKPLDLSKFQAVPNVIFNMLKPKTEQPISAPAAAGGGAQQNKTGATAPGTTPSNDMNKKAIIALLRQRGIEIADDASEEVILAALGKLGEKKADNPNPGETPEIKAAREKKAESDDKIITALRDQLENERKIRVTAEVNRRAANKVENKKLAWWVDLAMKDEQGTYDQLDALPAVEPGGHPLQSSITIVENRLEAIKKEPVASKRFESLRNEWSPLIQDAIARDSRKRQAPMAANTYSSSLITQFLLDGAVTKLQNRLAPLRAFSRDYSTDRYKPRATGQLKFATSGSTVQKNATNFESGDSTVTNVQIAVDQYTAAFHVTNDELNSGLRMENLVEVNMAAFADKLLYVAFSPLATAAFTTNAAIIRAAAAFSYSDMATAWGELKKSSIKYAILDGEYMARIINSPVFYQVTGTESGGQDGWRRFGWDGVYLNTNWTGTHAGANDQNIRGIFMNPQALGAIAGLPLTPPSVPGQTLQESSVTVPDVDMSVAAYSWFSLSSRTFWMSYDAMFGTSLLDESAGLLLTSS